MVRSILVVDDHSAFHTFARALLQAEGFDVVGEAEDGASALETVARLRPAVVLLDVQLPDLDGFEIAERLADRAARAAGGACFQPRPVLPPAPPRGHQRARLHPEGGALRRGALRTRRLTR